MKKLLAILLSALMLCAMIPFATVAAAEGDYYIELVANAEEVNAGDEITIEVSLYGHESVGLIGAGIELGFDPAVFELATTYDEDEEMWMPPIEVGPKFNASSNKYVMFPPIDEETGYMERCLVNFTRGTATATQAVKTNLFYTVTFKVKDDAVSGDYTIDIINYKDKNMVMHGNVAVVWTWEPISIKVNGTNSEPPVEECNHEYDNACDVDCNLCYETREVEHNVVAVEAKDATCYEDGNIAYWYCDVCGMAWLDAECTLNTNLKAVILPMAHAEATHVAAKDATCYENGNIEYWYCADCGQAWLDEACTLNTNLKAVILPMAHAEATYVAAKAATCTANGNIEYWYCEACGQAWLDEACTLNTNLKAVITPAFGHAYDDEFDADCNNCGELRDAACNHEYTYSCDAHCALCGELTRPNASHNIIAVEAVAATCYENGNIAYWYCSECGYAWADEALTQQTNLLSVVIPMAHAEATYVAAVAPSCYENGNIEYWYCADCGQAWLDEACTLNTNLKAVVLPMAHAEATYVAAVAPSCYENGNIEYWYCADCGQAWLDAECTLNTNLKAVILPMAHAEATYVAAKDATCVEMGNIEYWYCADCGQAWLDEACTLNTNLKAVILPLADHSYDSEYDADCNVCGDIRDVVSAPGSINFEGNSVSEEMGGLGFLFEIPASNVQIKWWNFYVQNSGTVLYEGSEYTLVTMGAIMNNQGDSDLTLEKVDDKYTLNVEGIRLYDLTDDALYFAVRAINLPLNKVNTMIYARPYMVLEKDGTQIIIYGDVVGNSYNGAKG